MKGWGLMELIKDWSIEYIFFEHRYPVLFLSSSKGELFLCCRSEDESCVSTKVSVNHCRKMLTNKLTIREAFTKSESPIFLEEQLREASSHCGGIQRSRRYDAIRVVKLV